ncbi:RcgR family putative quorum lactone hydrolase [Shinella sp.]|uniref:RcgR family putative quorum lactone hydrolase n=1 Tax=Shinella sp. TaxID=1870904 RepID=UPI0028A690E5|nr:dienelactone hydrolase-related enzyme [Shinella sp.]
MYHKWLDRWDERRARRGEEGKHPTAFALDAELAFPGADKVRSIEEFCLLAEEAQADQSFFERPDGGDQGFQRQDEWLKFPSDITTDVEENNTVWAKIAESGSLDHALVVFHHWNARARNNQLARFLSRRGITVVEIAMPYHFERSRPGSTHADYMLSASLGRTIQSIRQAVLDGRKLIRWLKSEGYKQISVLGMSLGSWVAGLIAAHDSTVSKASLFLTAGSLADMVWTGRATRTIQGCLAPRIELTDLRRAWCHVNMENYGHRLARSGLNLQVVLGKRDKAVKPEVSENFMQKLSGAGARPRILDLNCGHYSLAMPPYSLMAGLSLDRFLHARNQPNPQLGLRAL